MKARADIIQVVEGAYSLDGTEQEWLQGVADAARPLLDHGLGIVAYLHEPPRDRGVALSPVVISGAHTRELESAAAANIELPPEGVHAYNTFSGCATSSEILGSPLETFPMWQPFLQMGGFRDTLATRSIVDPRGGGCMIHALLPNVMRSSPKMRYSWSRVAAHLSAGLRLRRALQGHTVDAIVSPTGKIEHAEDAATTATAREQLRDAALRIDRARGQLRRRDSVEALELWEGLVAGRWSLVEHFERRGRRYLVARRNDPGVTDPRGLGLRERQVAWYASLGHSNKLIAYEMGITPSSVASHLARAMTKLGLQHRTQLIALLSAAAPKPAPPPDAPAPPRRRR